MARVLKYHQAKFEIMNLIASNHLKEGDRLPTIHEMNGRFSFSEICLRRALNELEGQGYLRKHKGLGIFLTRTIDTWTISGDLLYLEILMDGDGVPLAAPPASLKRYLRERSISLRAVTASRPDAEALRAAGNCLGVIVTGWVTEEWVRFLSAISLPVLYLGVYPCTRGLPSIAWDYEDGVRLMLERFHAQGCKKIGLFNSAEGYYPSELNRLAYLREGRRLGMDVSPRNICWEPAVYSTNPGDFLNKRGPFDALLVEPGGLSHLLIFLRQTGQAEHTLLGVLGPCDAHRSTERVAFLKYDHDVMAEAGRVFFESLNDPDYFRNGPCLLKPHIA